MHGSIGGRWGSDGQPDRWTRNLRASVRRQRNELQNQRPTLPLLWMSTRSAARTSGARLQGISRRVLRRIAAVLPIDEGTEGQFGNEATPAQTDDR